ASATGCLASLPRSRVRRTAPIPRVTGRPPSSPRSRSGERSGDALSTQDTVIATLLWLAVAVAYGYWVWRLRRLWRAAPDGRARRRPAEVALLRPRPKTVMVGRDRQTSV